MRTCITAFSGDANITDHISPFLMETNFIDHHMSMLILSITAFDGDEHYTSSHVTAVVIYHCF